MRKTKRSFQTLAGLLVLSMLCTLFPMNPTPAFAEVQETSNTQETDLLHTFRMSPTDDTFVRGSGPFANSNYGKETSLAIKKGNLDLTRESYMKFDFTNIYTEIESVKLVVFGVASEGKPTPIKLYQTENHDWTEETLTWSSKPPYKTEIVADFMLEKDAKSFEIDITEQVQANMTADKLLSLAFIQPDVSGGQGLLGLINSKESVSNQPYVEVTYRAPEDTTAPAWPPGSELTAALSGDDSISLNWNKAVDDQAVTAYRIIRDGQMIAEIDAARTHYKAGGLSVSGAHSFKVEASDPSGNWTIDGPETTVTTPDVITVPPVEDTHVNAGSAGQTNYGTSDKLLVKNMKADPNVTRQAFMKFDSGALPEEIGTATLHFYGSVVDGGGSHIETAIFGLENHTWKESEMTWNNRPEAVHYLSKVTINKNLGWHQADVTAYVKNQLDRGSQHVSFGLIQLEEVGLVAAINSKENAENKPYLKISSSRANESAPSWPSGSSVHLQSMGENTVTIGWNAADDQTGVTQYRIYQEGMLRDTVGSQTREYSVAGLEVGQRYTFTIQAGNAAGEWSEDGPILTVRLPETKFKQTVLGNVFMNNEPAKFIVETVRPNVSWQAYDLNGTKVAEGTKQVESGQAIIEVPNTGLGYFTLEAQAEQSGSLPIRIKTTYSVLTPFTAPPNGGSPFGLNTHLHRIAYGWNADLVQLIKYAGATFVRDGIEWSGIEKEKGVYSFPPALENYMERLKDEGIPLLFVAAYNNPFYDNNGTPFTDAGRLGMANYAKAYVEHYKDQILAMNVYNEFNGGFGKRGNSPANSQASYYYELLKKTYEVVKAEHQDLPIVGIVSAGINLEWIGDVLQRGGMNYLDAIAVQQYEYPNNPEGLAGKLENLKTLIKQHNNGELVPIWLTEFGWPTFLGARGIDEKLQADYLLQGHVIALASGVDKMVWYDLMDDGMQADLNEDNFGIIRNEKSLLGAHTAKPAYVSYAVMTRELTGAQFEEKESVDAPIHSYRFSKDGQPVRVVWSNESMIIQMASSNPFEVMNMMGNVEQYTPVNGKVTLSLGSEPYYVLGEVDDISVETSITISGAAIAAGDGGKFIIALTNNSQKRRSLTYEVEGKTYPVIIESGQTARTEIMVSDTREGYRNIPIYVMEDGKKTGQLGYQLQIDKAREVKVRPAIELSKDEDGQFKQVLHVDVANFSKIHQLDVQRVEWSIANHSGIQNWDASIAPEQSGQLSITLPDYAFGENYKASVRVVFNETDIYRYDGSFGFNPITERKIEPGKEMDPELAAMAPTIDLQKAKEVKLAGVSGNIDVRGKIWLNYDRDHFYLTAQIDDKVHAAELKGDQIWNNDSIQFAVAAGVPGESSSWYEFGLSSTPDGPQMYRFAGPPGSTKGPVESGKLVVERDESSKTTMYQMALPWSELSPVLPLRHEVMSFSLLVNDNNGDGRRGWMEWGSGIGLEKRGSLFQTMQWVHTEDLPIAEDASYQAEAGKDLLGKLTVKASSDDALTYEIVTKAKQGTVELVDPSSGEFRYTASLSAAGEDQFTFRVHDGYGYSNTATVKLTIAKKQQPPSVFPINTKEGELYIPAGAAGEISKERQIKLSIPAGATTSGATFKIEELNNRNIQQQGLRLLSSVFELSQNAEAELTKPAELRLFYEGKAAQDEKIVLVRYDEQQKVWIIVDAKADEEYVAAYIQELGIYAVAALQQDMPKTQPVLTDLAGHWSRESIEQAVAAGLVTGFPDRTFRPDQTVTRQDFITMLVRMAELQNKNTRSQAGHGEPVKPAVRFNDAANISSYARQAVEQAVAAGWISGYSDGGFKPQGEMLRTELAAVLARISSLHSTSGEQSELTKQLDQLFTDAKDIPSWAQGYVEQAVANGLMQGNGNGRFNPLGKVTRAEAAIIALNLQKFLQKMD
ncbi:CBM96 family carbohydrate-binding protein [Paenibacillus sp. IITD108]|uniref:CBM96 family carbohydrate-binding protein n=1 Tax=Paenibacillus sp. IITD108 TaxID=3116649 RepID=UPI002F415488